MLLLVPGEPLGATSCGPYTIDLRVSDVNYIVCTPDRRKSRRISYVKMLKVYHFRLWR